MKGLPIHQRKGNVSQRCDRQRKKEPTAVLQGRKLRTRGQRNHLIPRFRLDCASGCDWWLRPGYIASACCHAQVAATSRGGVNLDGAITPILCLVGGSYRAIEDRKST